jgi:lycopene beta-cyclase
LFKSSRFDFDYALVGGGLQAGLIALALRAAQPSARVAIVERETRLGGEHLWSFHAGDVPPAARAFVEPLVVRRWPRWRAAFPGLDRTFQRPYASVTSTRLHEVVSRSIVTHAESALLLGAEARRVSAHEVELVGGRVLSAGLVIDARGPERARLEGRVAFQKFVGLELELERPLEGDAADTATVFDATVEQTDGFRFFYVLPFAPDRVLVEETFYADGASLDRAALRASILAYAEARGLRVRAVVREERGVLPLPVERFTPPAESDGGSPLVAGYAGGFFHPTTGYSLPVAARVAAIVGAHAPEHAALALAPERARVERQARFCTLLNRLLFRAIAPESRRNVLERFHTLPEETVLRFYALETTPADRARILCGRPPRGMSLRRALATLAGGPASRAPREAHADAAGGAS